MALEDNGLVMPVAPTGGFGGGFGGGDSWAWIILLLLLGWGNNGGGFGGGNGGNIYPWMNQSNQISDGFRDQMINGTINGIQSSVTSGFGDIQTALCGGFAGVNAAIANANTANLERSFAVQTANSQSFNSLQSQLATCCCENRLANCQTNNLISTEGAATRLAIQEQTQAILDKMCQQEIDALKSQNLALQNQVNMQALAASQATQTAALIADNTAQTQYIVNRVAPYPIPAYTVANPITPAAI
jgi:hypothetical protein